jgi:hypothetical protein
MMPLLAHAGTPDELAATLLIFTGVCAGWVAWQRLRHRSFARLPAWVAWSLAPVAVGLVVLSFIVPALLRPKVPARASGARPASTATLSFERPAAGESVPGDELAVVLRLRGGRVVAATSTDLRPDEGHVHLSLDGRVVSMTYGTLQTVDLRDAAPGTHELDAEFVAADHAPFDPRVTASVRFEVPG